MVELAIDVMGLRDVVVVTVQACITSLGVGAKVMIGPRYVSIAALVVAVTVQVAGKP